MPHVLVKPHELVFGEIWVLFIAIDLSSYNDFQDYNEKKTKKQNERTYMMSLTFTKFVGSCRSDGI